ncbi:MAG: PadR family transcriptional regulator [Desulfurococcales archaeon]|nr:PadR family transcriptional regulator [Desulfurococcales archaeon]
MAPAGKPLARLQRKLTVEILWIYVLAVLASRGPTYAYNVRRLISEIFGFKPSTVTLYTVIYRLEREGLIAKEGGEYAITDSGRAALSRGICLLRGILSQLAGLASEAGVSTCS